MPQIYIFSLALVGGILPSLVWLFFWLKEDKLNPEPRLALLSAFIAGMIAVPLVLPVQKFFFEYFAGVSFLTLTIWAFSEELFKLIAAFFSSLRTRFMDEPIDALIYMITVALGFSALENALFLSSSLNDAGLSAALITGGFRFIGATLLHIISSATIGAAISLSFYKSRGKKIIYSLIGLLIATIIHTSFNLFITKEDGLNAFFAFVSVWGLVVILMLVFEKVKQSGKERLQSRFIHNPIGK